MATAIQSLDSLFVHLSLAVDPQITVARYALDSRALPLAQDALPFAEQVRRALIRNRGGGKGPRPRDLPEAQLVRELRSRGLPEPTAIRRVEGYTAGDRPMVRWLEFQTRRFNGTQGNGLAGFELEFAEPVTGPIAV